MTQAKTCNPTLASSFFDSAVADPSLVTTNAPCPAGYQPGFDSDPGNGSVERFSTQSSFVDKYCAATDGGASPVSVDFATSDVVVVRAWGAAPLSALHVNAELWTRTNDSSSCSGAYAGYPPTFFILPKGQELKIEACTTTCTCDGAPCLFP